MAKRTFSDIGDVQEEHEVVRQMRSEVPKKRNKKMSILLGAVSAVFVVGAVVCIGLAFHEKSEDKEIVEMWDNVKTIADVEETVDTINPNVATASSSDGTEDEVTATVVAEDGTEIVLKEKYSKSPMDRKIDWDALSEINSDIVAWVYIPGTGVDYPILQEQTFGKSFYLTHNVYKVSQKSGAIFIPKQQHDSDIDFHTLIYGHHMKNGSMFGILTNYKKKEFYDTHKYIYIYYPDRTEKWGIWTVEHVLEDDKVYMIPYMDGSAEYTDLINHLEEKSLYETDYFGINNRQRTLTLSTCDHVRKSSEGESGRFVVNAVLLDVTTPNGELIYETTDTLNELGGNENIIISDEDEEYDGYDVDVTTDSEIINMN